MAGKDDIRLLASYVYSKTKGMKPHEAEVHAVGAVVMNRATSLGSLPEAVMSMNPTPDMMEVMQGNIKGKQSKEYKRVIQLTSKLLRGQNDPTSGAIELLPKKSKNTNPGLIKSHATANHTFFRESKAGGMSNVQKAIV
jgi:hypothetical protein